jgi:hypothetical protein
MSIIYKLKLTYITQPISHCTHFDLVDRGRMLFRNPGMHLQDYTVSQPLSEQIAAVKF